jgi:dihydroorotase
MRLTITTPDDWHLHLRDGAALATTVPHTARQFRRAVIMPNLTPPVTTADLASAYRERILAAAPEDSKFDPLLTLYLTDNTSVEEIHRAQSLGHVYACKLYPAGATTNSDFGVTDLNKLDPVLEAMQSAGLPLLIHGEVTDSAVDIFDREAVFIQRHLIPLLKRHPDLKIVLEHLTTADGVAFVQSAPDNVAATITAHHLLYNRNAIFAGGLNPHMYCLPVLKREQHRESLLRAATSGSGKFFLGTDSAPHPVSGKEKGCGCAGIYTAHAALELYATAFEAAGALDRLEGFASFYGPDFYGLPRNKGTVTLEKREWEIPARYGFGVEEVVPLEAGKRLAWRFCESAD